ncbi:MAG: MFS transporter [Verrucomicrobia bacterium]|nr:MFS transporter [Verrucomicrobiota bacterium]
MSQAPASQSAPPAAPKRALSLGVIFLTLYIDLIGFSIIFPLGPDLLGHYLSTDGRTGSLGWLLAQTDALAASLGRDNAFATVLFGGVLSSFFSILQFIGALTSQLNLLTANPELARFGINPFSVPALFAFVLCLVNLVWIHRRFNETLTPAVRAEARDPRIRNPVTAIFGLADPGIRRVNLVRKLLARVEETRVLSAGLVCSAVGLLAVGFAMQPWLLYAGLALLAAGSGLVNPASTGLISLYCGPHEQGRVLGIFRSLGSLARAITPVVAGAAFWLYGSRSVFLAAAVFAIGAFSLSLALPKPAK